MQNRRFRIGVGLAAVLLALAGIGMGTYALFNDVEDGPPGTVASGTLDLVVGSGTATELLNVTNIKPGFTQTASVTLNNVGSLPGIVSTAVGFTGRDVTCTEPERVAEGITGTGACNATGDLQNQLTVAVVSGPNGASAAVPLTTFVTNQGLGAGGTIAAGGTATYQLQFALPDLATNNLVQGDQIILTSNFTLTQA